MPSAGLLQPLPLPSIPWEDITMDFIEGLPRSDGKNAIFVVVDHFTKYGHFMALQHPFTAATVAKFFLDNVYKLHGTPSSINSDRGSIFLSNFSIKLFKKLGSIIHHSTSYRLQTDRQTVRRIT